MDSMQNDGEYNSLFFDMIQGLEQLMSSASGPDLRHEMRKEMPRPPTQRKKGKKAKKQEFEKRTSAGHNFLSTNAGKKFKSQLVDGSTGMNIKPEAERRSMEMMQELWRKTVTGALTQEDLYGNGSQSNLRGREAAIVKYMWAYGMDYDGPLRSKFSYHCFNGELDKIKACIENDPTLIDRRETCLRMNSLLHVVRGSRSSHMDFPVEFRATNLRENAHVECVKYLLAQGVDLYSKDMIGNTALHLCTCYFVTEESLRIAQLLLDNGFNINTQNRLGDTALMDPISNGFTRAIKLLLNNGIDTSIRNYDGQNAESGLQTTEVKKLLFDHYSKRASNIRNDLRDQGVFKACKVCKQKGKAKRCTGCYLVWYCSRNCQVSDWDSHRAECKETMDSYKLAELDKDTDFTLFNFASGKATSKLAGEKPTVKQAHFVVKAQLQFDIIDPVPKSITVYNEDRSIMGVIPRSAAIYGDLKDAIRNGEHTCGGIKGYFYAIYKKGKLKINCKTQPGETW